MSHTSETVALARRLHGATWSLYAIEKLLRRQGISVSATTIASWVDPVFADRRRVREARRSRVNNAIKTRGRLGAGPPRSPEFRLERMRNLRSLGLSFTAVATVMTFDFPGEPVTGDVVRYALETGTPPPVYRAAVPLQREAGEAA